MVDFSNKNGLSLPSHHPYEWPIDVVAGAPLPVGDIQPFLSQAGSREVVTSPGEGGVELKDSSC